ncbi:MAG: hypothetical protein JJ894_02395 [Dinoroseobacter sp.]|nr:hypothetical protein [Dinoroseobacter sp.]
MIHAARSELSGLLTRAGVGRGLPIGIADELTAAALAYCSLGEDGAGAALAALAPDPEAPIYSGGVLQGSSLPMFAPSAFDLAASGTVTLNTDADTELLAGYALARGNGWSIQKSGSQLRLRRSNESALAATTTASPPFAVSFAVWDALKELGLGALVPATPETEAGAGAGAIDND